MQKLTTTKKLVAASFLVGVLGLSSAPLGVSAESYHHNNNWDNSWSYRSHRDYRHHDISDRDAHYIAERTFPGRHYERVNYRFYGSERYYDVVFFDGYHVIIRASDGYIVGTYYQR